ncbi:MAG: DUF3368 domain-containing protein [Scytonema sp. PMC 1069.18]|nr:DUF3368 domain-containing protein [Scytonema sp. PMC 1069.18]MEC4885401.1 DUF3368 domain-containing protein [Scytonema sp. PMC 1070.18]
MLVVSNTSPLLNLAMIGQLSLLKQQFGQIQIPTTVLEELRVNEALPGSVQLREALEAGWLQVQELDNQALVLLLLQDLDKGEAEAIALALQLRADWIILDEREGRRIAHRLGLRVTGLLGVLLRARRAGELTSLPKVINQLREQAGFRIAPTLLTEILRDNN